MNAQVKISAVKLFEVTFPDGTTEMMESVGRWPEGLSRLRTNDGNILIIAHKPKDKFANVFEEIFSGMDDDAEINADVVMASQPLLERLKES